MREQHLEVLHALIGGGGPKCVRCTSHARVLVNKGTFCPTCLNILVTIGAALETRHNRAYAVDLVNTVEREQRS